MKKLLATILAVFLLASPAWAAFPVVQASNTSVQNSSTTSHTVALPASIAAGELLVGIVTVQRSSTTTTLNSFITIPTGWTALCGSVGPSTDGVDDVVTRIFAKIATGSEGASVTVTTASRVGTHQTHRISGHSVSINGGITGLECGTPATGETQDPDPPTLTPSWGAADTLWMAIGSKEGGLTATPAAPTNFGTVVHATNDSAATSRTSTTSATRSFNTTVQDPSVIDYSDGGSSWIGFTIAVQPAAATRRPLAPLIFQ